MTTLVEKITPIVKVPKKTESSKATTKNKAAHHETSLRMSAFQRLNLGPVGPECLRNPALKPMIDPTWKHLGGEPVRPVLDCWKLRWHQICQKVKAIGMRNSNPILSDDAILERTTFKPFHYEIGKRIDFASGKFSFIYSENYFQRFFIDEADAQFRECFRLLEEGGVLRIVVPDADLRMYEVPEPLDFPLNKKWADPEKHKTRWSIYSLVYVLENCGYHVKPIAWTDKQGGYHFESPASNHHVYTHTADSRFAFDLSYCANLQTSLVIDAVKPPKGETAPRGHLVSQLHPIETRQG